MRFIDLTGQVFERLTVISFEKRVNRVSLFNCICICGNTKLLSSNTLLMGKTKSCGCLKKEIMSKTKSTHTKTKHPLYTIWCAMKRRCYNQNVKDYPNYGGRGISVCDKWLNDFQAFYDDMFFNYDKGLTIERINNNGNYEVSNCKWVSRKIQNRNKRTVNKIEIDGEFKCLSEWAEIYKINLKTVSNRFYTLGWDIRKSLTSPKKINQFI